MAGLTAHSTVIHNAWLRASPNASLREAREAAGESVEINPSDALAYVSLGRIFTLEALWRMKRGEDPSSAFEEAKARLEKGIDLDPNDANGYVAMAEVCRRITEWSSRVGRHALVEISEGLRMTDQALSLRAGHGETLALRAALLLWQAEAEANGAQRKLVLQRGAIHWHWLSGVIR